MTEMTEKRRTDANSDRPVPDLNRYSRHYVLIIQVLLGHAKLNNMALYANVATRTVLTVTSPLDKLGLLRPTEISPGR